MEAEIDLRLKAILRPGAVTQRKLPGSLFEIREAPPAAIANARDVDISWSRGEDFRPVLAQDDDLPQPIPSFKKAP